MVVLCDGRMYSGGCCTKRQLHILDRLLSERPWTLSASEAGFSACSPAQWRHGTTEAGWHTRWRELQHSPASAGSALWVTTQLPWLKIGRLCRCERRSPMCRIAAAAAAPFRVLPGPTVFATTLSSADHKRRTKNARISQQWIYNSHSVIMQDIK